MLRFTDKILKKVQLETQLKSDGETEQGAKNVGNGKQANCPGFA